MNIKKDINTFKFNVKVEKSSSVTSILMMNSFIDRDVIAKHFADSFYLINDIYPATVRRIVMISGIEVQRSDEPNGWKYIPLMDDNVIDTLEELVADPVVVVPENDDRQKDNIFKPLQPTYNLILDDPKPVQPVDNSTPVDQKIVTPVQDSEPVQNTKHTQDQKPVTPLTQNQKSTQINMTPRNHNNKNHN